MKKILLTLVAGLLLGVLVTMYFFGAPRVRSMPGVPIKPPDRSGDNAGTVSVTIEEKFFDSLLGTIFTKLGPPQLKLSQLETQPLIRPAAFQSSCNSVLVLNAEGDNTKTGVRFTGGKIVAPIAFSGTYSVLSRCMSFKGAGQSTVELRFDQSKQTVYGRLNVEEVTLDDVPPIISALVTAFVRRSIDEQLNPFEVLEASQLSLSLPVQASGGTVKANVKDVRSEIQEGSLKLYLTYDFSAEKK